MAYVVTEKCQDCRFTDCVEVCPVACFYPLQNQLIINPDECIDCSACVPECPVEAIYEESEVPEEYAASIAFNADEAARLEGEGVDAIDQTEDALPTAEARKAALGF
ncbi:MAG: ferredoxin [Verrucomicrobiales bacterium]|jgi:ferredoxin